MDIICPQCRTEYEFDDAKVTEAGVTVRCAQCDYTFKVRRRQVVETEPVDGDTGPEPVEDKLWMVRTRNGEIHRFKELPTLQQWIVERKVSRDDEISRTGETWKRLGEIAELSSFFQVVDAAAIAGPQSLRPPMPPTLSFNGPPSPAPGRRPGGSGALNAAVPRTQPALLPSDEEMSMGGGFSAGDDEPAFAAAAAGASFRTIGPQAAWEGGGRRVGAVEELEDEVPRGRLGRTISLVVIGVLVVGLGAFAAVKPRAVKGFFGSLFGGSEDVSAAYSRGRELFLRDDEQSLRQADLELSKAPETSAIAIAGRVEVATTWSQYLRHHAELLARHARQLDAQAAAIEPPEPPRRGKKVAPAADPPDKTRLIEEAKSLRLRASSLRHEASQKLAGVEALALAAKERAPDRAEVLRALGDLRRMQGQRDEPVLSLLRRALRSKPDDPETFHVEGSYWDGVGNQAKATDLLKEAMARTRAYTKQTLLRAAFQLAMIHLRGGRRVEARALAQEIVAANDQHEWAKELLAQVEREERERQGSAAAAGVAAAGQPADPGAESTSASGDSTSASADSTSAGASVSADSQTRGDSARTGGRRPADPAIPVGGSYAALIKAGDRLAEHGRTMQSMQAYEAALRKEANGVEALTGIAFCQLDLQRYSLAIRGFRKAMNISPTYGDAMVGMAEAYKAMGNKSKALDYYKAYLRAHPTGSKGSLAQRNITEIERALGTSPPAPAPPSDVAPDPAPGPAPGPAPDPAPDPAPGPGAPESDPSPAPGGAAPADPSPTP